MTTSLNLEQHSAALATVVEEYNQWYGGVLRYVQYPSQLSDTVAIEPPSSFEEWQKEAQSAAIEAQSLERLSNIHKGLIRYTTETIKEVEQRKNPPSYEEFDKLVTHFEEFIININRLEQDIKSSNLTVDQETGLRSKAALDEDFKKEMERVSRQGRQFAVALIRINNPEEIAENRSEAFPLVVDTIKGCMRTFDDAYLVGEHEFLLSLKLTDASGSLSALKRMESVILSKDIQGPRPKLLSCIAEPVPGDDIDELLKNIRYELDSFPKDEIGIIEFMDTSPLERFVNQQGD